jgi:hypothetical protein
MPARERQPAQLPSGADTPALDAWLLLPRRASSRQIHYRASRVAPNQARRSGQLVAKSPTMLFTRFHWRLCRTPAREWLADWPRRLARRPASRTQITRRYHGGRPRRCHVTQPRAGSNVRAKRKSAWKPEHPSRRQDFAEVANTREMGARAGSDSPAQALGLNSLLPGYRAGSKALPAGSSTSSRRRTCD